MTVLVHLLGGPDDGRTIHAPLDGDGLPVLDALDVPAGYGPVDIATDASGHPSTARWVTRWAYERSGVRHPCRYGGRCYRACPSRRKAGT